MKWQLWCALIAIGMFVAGNVAFGQEEGSSGGGGYGVVRSGGGGGGSGGGFGGSGGSYIAVQGQARAEAERARAEAGRAMQEFRTLHLDRPAKLEKAPYLGISASPATAALREQLKLAKGTGLVVEVVEPGSPADKAGLKQYDVLQKLDEQILVNSDQLVVLIRTFKPGDEVRLLIIRQGESRTIMAKLAEKELPPLSDAGFSEVQPWIRFATQEGKFVNVSVDKGSAMIDWKDAQHELKMTSDDGKAKRLIVIDKAGTRVFEGPIDTESQRQKLPEGILPKVIRMEQSMPPKLNGLQLGAPATRPASMRMERGGTY